jgi:hypothetical protein
VRVDTPDGLCYNKAPFGRETPLNGHFPVHLPPLLSMGSR